MDDLFRNQLHKKDGSNASTTTLRPRLHDAFVPALTNKYFDFSLDLVYIKSKKTKKHKNQNDCQFSAPPPTSSNLCKQPVANKTHWLGKTLLWSAF